MPFLTQIIPGISLRIGSLIKGLADHRNYREIVSSIVRLSTSLNLTVIAVAAVSLMTFFAVRQIIKDNKKGCSSCGGKCGSCPYGCSCRGKKG